MMRGGVTSNIIRTARPMEAIVIRVIDVSRSIDTLGSDRRRWGRHDRGVGTQGGEVPCQTGAVLIFHQVTAERFLRVINFAAIIQSFRAAV